jgi:hypothetical protein
VLDRVRGSIRAPFKVPFAICPARRAGPLLNDVHRFVGDRAQVRTAGGERDLVTHRVRVGAHVMTGGARRGIRVGPDRIQTMRSQCLLDPIGMRQTMPGTLYPARRHAVHHRGRTGVLEPVNHARDVLIPVAPLQLEQCRTDVSGSGSSSRRVLRPTGRTGRWPGSTAHRRWPRTGFSLTSSHERIPFKARPVSDDRRLCTLTTANQHDRSAPIMQRAPKPGSGGEADEECRAMPVYLAISTS